MYTLNKNLVSTCIFSLRCNSILYCIHVDKTPNDLDPRNSVHHLTLVRAFLDWFIENESKFFNEFHIHYGSGKFSYSLKTSSHTCTKENPKYTEEKMYM